MSASPPVFVPIFGPTRAHTQALVRQAARYTRFFELRTDLSPWAQDESPHALRTLFPDDAQVLFTNRSIPEVSLSQSHSFELLNIDYQYDLPPLQHPEKTMLSFHEFRPATTCVQELEPILTRMASHHAAYTKLALTLTTSHDLQWFRAHIPAWQQDSRTQWVVMGMGTYGPESRILAARAGLATFAALPGSTVVPGQIHLHDLFAFLRPKHTSSYPRP